MSDLKIVLFKVDVMLRKVNNFHLESKLDKLQPVVMLKTCPKPPCEGKHPCLRLCPVFSNRPSYPNIKSSNIEACYGDGGEFNCSAINERVAQTLFGNTTGNNKCYR